MSIIEALILGVIQGLTEFLPISSSGHLDLAGHIFGMKDPDQHLAFVLLLHLASLAAVVAYYRRRLLELLSTRRREFAYIVLATLPIVAVGALLEKRIEAVHAMPLVICSLLVVNGIFLFVSDRRGRGTQPVAEAPWWKALVVGIAQGIRLPGLSRSGSTIGTGWLVGLSRSEAVRFSFLLSIPAILGAAVWKGRHLASDSLTISFVPALIGVVVTFGLSMLSIRVVEGLAVGKRWLIFAGYSVAAGLAGLVYFTVKG